MGFFTFELSKNDFLLLFGKEISKMTVYNAKINMNGKYLPFYGWSTVSMMNSDSTIGFAENFIKNDPILSSYFAALPTDSYHVTVCNIWCNGRPLLKHQKKFLLSKYPRSEAIKLEEKASEIGFFNPNGCMNELLDKMAGVINQSEDGTELIIDKLYFSGSTLGISFSEISNTTKLDKCRDNSLSVAELGKDYIVPYHLTLAYNYRNVNISDVSLILEKLNAMLQGRVITLECPTVSYFSNMTKFIPYSLAKHLNSEKKNNNVF